MGVLRLQDAARSLLLGECIVELIIPFFELLERVQMSACRREKKKASIYKSRSLLGVADDSVVRKYTHSLQGTHAATRGAPCFVLGSSVQDLRTSSPTAIFDKT